MTLPVLRLQKDEDEDEDGHYTAGSGANDDDGHTTAVLWSHQDLLHGGGHAHKVQLELDVEGGLESCRAGEYASQQLRGRKGRAVPSLHYP